MPVVEETDGGVLAVMKRFTIDEVIARRNDKMTENVGNVGNVGNLSETCRKLVGNLSGTELSNRQWAICEIIKDNPYSTAESMSIPLKVSARTIERELSALQKLGVVRREGKKNTGIWVVLENHVG